MKMNKVTRTMKIVVECMWFALTILCSFVTIKELFRHNTSNALMFAALTLAALFFFLLRRNQRKNLENNK